MISLMIFQFYLIKNLILNLPKNQLIVHGKKLVLFKKIHLYLKNLKKKVFNLKTIIYLKIIIHKLFLIIMIKEISIIY